MMVSRTELDFGLIMLVMREDQKAENVYDYDYYVPGLCYSFRLSKYDRELCELKKLSRMNSKISER